MNSMKIGVVGCGYWGAKHIRSLLELGVCDVVACDSDASTLANARRAYPGIATAGSLQELLEADVAGVIVATPISSHFDVARQCLISGKDVLVEKPLTMNLDQAEALVEIAERRRAVLMVGHTFLYHPAVEAVLNLITSGKLGDIFHVDTARLNLGLFQPDTNVLWDLAPHDLSILLYLLGDGPVSISARGGAHVDPRVHDNVYIDLVFPGSTTAHVHVSWLEPRKIRRVTVIGAHRIVVYDDVSPIDKVWVYDKGIAIESEPADPDRHHLSYRHGDTTILHTAPDEPLQVEQRHFVQCIKERQRPKTDGFAGLQIVQLLDCAQQSLDAGGDRVDVGELVVPPDPHLGSGLEQIVALRLARAAHAASRENLRRGAEGKQT